MKQLVEFTTEAGASVVVEIEDDEPGIGRVARAGEVVPAAAGKLEDALDVVRPTAEALVGKLTSLARVPDEIHVEFGIRMNFKAGAVVASTEGEGHFKVALKWMHA